MKYRTIASDTEATIGDTNGTSVSDTSTSVSEDSPEPRRIAGVIANKGRSLVKSFSSLLSENNEPFVTEKTLDVSEIPVVLKIRSIPEDEDQRTTYPFTDSVRDPTPANSDSSSAAL